MRRFFVSTDTIQGEEVVITGDLFRHLVKVLRMKSGDRLILADGTGQEVVGMIVNSDRQQLSVTIIEKLTVEDEYSGPEITLYQGLPKNDKMELILQKCTELGIHRVIPFLSSRTVPQLTPQREAERLNRWQRIAQEAAQQCNRRTIPQVSAITELRHALAEADQQLKLLPWEEERTTRLRPLLSALPRPERIALMAGPEGGLAAAEVQQAVAAGFTPVSLGQRILRTETAGFALLTVLQYLWGDLG